MKLHVAWASDNEYAPHTGASILSVLDQNSKLFDGIVVHILGYELDNDNKEKLMGLGKGYKDAEIRFYDVSAIDKLVQLHRTSSFPPVAFAKVLLPELLDESIDKVLYLDSDTIVRRTLRKLVDFDLKGYHVGAVLDLGRKEHKIRSGYKESEHYFSTGVLLMNLKKWREDGTADKIIAKANQTTERLPFPDQDIINNCLQETALILPPRYNAMHATVGVRYENLKLLTAEWENYYAEALVREANTDPVIVHFSGPMNHPWAKNCLNPFADLYEKYQAMSPWPLEISDTEEGSWQQRMKYKACCKYPHWLARSICGKGVQKKAVPQVRTKI